MFVPPINQNSVMKISVNLIYCLYILLLSFTVLRYFYCRLLFRDNFTVVYCLCQDETRALQGQTEQWDGFFHRAGTLISGFFYGFMTVAGECDENKSVVPGYLKFNTYRGYHYYRGGTLGNGRTVLCSTFVELQKPSLVPGMPDKPGMKCLSKTELDFIIKECVCYTCRKTDQIYYEYCMDEVSGI